MSIVTDYSCTGNGWSVIENIKTEPSKQRHLLSTDDLFVNKKHGRGTNTNICFGFQENMDEEGKDKHAENMVIEGMITKDEDVNPESSKTIEQQAIMDDTENIHINEVIIIFSHVIIIVILAGQNNM